MAICAIVSITVTATTIALWLKHNIKHIKQVPLLVQQQTLHHLWVLTNPKAPSTSEMWSSIYPCYLSGSVQLFFYTAFHHQSSYSLACATVVHYSAFLFLFVLCHCHSLGMNGGGGAAYAQESLSLLRHSPWLWLVVFYQEWWFLANQIRATGWSHRQWIFT